jgi:hypothetical protein
MDLRSSVGLLWCCVVLFIGCGAPGGGTDGGSGSGGGSAAGGGAGGGSAASLDTSGNSCNQRTATSGSTVDLAIGTLNTGWSWDSTTRQLSVQFSYMNTGSTDAAMYGVGLFLYPDAAQLCQAYHVGQFTRAGLTHGYIHSGTASVTLTDVPPGSYKVGFVVDYDSKLGEASEANNVAILNGTLQL